MGVMISSSRLGVRKAYQIHTCYVMNDGKIFSSGFTHHIYLRQGQRAPSRRIIALEVRSYPRSESRLLFTKDLVGR